jgi:hypothetical protein
MKLTIIPQLTFSLCLIALGAGQTALAAKPAPDPQEQARALLTGKYSSASDVKPRPLPASVASTTSAAVGGQEQAQRMILGDPARTNTAPAAASNSAAIDGQEQARRMILGGAAKTNRARAAAG